MKRDCIIKKSWRQLKIDFPVSIAPPTFASPQAAYAFFTKHQDEFPDIDYVEPKDSDLDGSVTEFGHDALDTLDTLAGVMSFPVIPGAQEKPAAQEDVAGSQDVDSSPGLDSQAEESDI